MTPEVAKAFDFASDATKQLIALSTGILTLTLTFATDIFEDVELWVYQLLLFSWGIYIVSIICGLLTLLFLTGQLQPVNGSPVPSIRDSKLASASGLQIITFLIATILIVISGASAISTVETEALSTNTIQADRVISIEVTE